MNKNEYARSNKEWLAGKAKEDGVTQLAKGVCYKVLQSGPKAVSSRLRTAWSAAIISAGP